jgi:hypothetical protein
MVKLNKNFVIGLVVGEGCFAYDRRKQKDGSIRYVPNFTLRMHVRDIDLVRAIRNYLDVDQRVYEYIHNNRHYGMFNIRNIGDIKNIIVPFFYKNLKGHKAKQFEAWLERMGREDTAERYKLVFRLYKNGWYDDPVKRNRYGWDKWS